MTDEEREAIEQLRSWREYIIKHKEDVNKANDIEFYLRTAINLIEKQSKEIEELKEKRDIYYYEWKHLEAKIEAKIEELEIEKEKYFEKQVIQHEIEVLRSLLNKEMGDK